MISAGYLGFMLNKIKTKQLSHIMQNYFLTFVGRIVNPIILIYLIIN